jgi:hypothetical protein
MKMIKEHSPVVLTEDLPALALLAGDVGVVVHVHQNGAAYEVEFLTIEGDTCAIETLKPQQLRPVGKREIPHVRELLAA